MKVLLRIFLLLACVLGAAMILFLFSMRDRRPRIALAAEDGDTNFIARYLASGSNVNDAVVSDRFGRRYAPLLLIAAKSWQSNTVSFLIEKGADPNLPNTSGETPIYCVIGRSCDNQEGLEIVQKLLNAGADPNLPSSSYKWTPLILAATLGCPEMVRLLIAAGADVNATNADGTTPLYHADNAEVAQCLLAAGANRNASFSYEVGPGVTKIITAADHALEEKRFGVLAVLTNAVVQTNKPPLTPLHPPPHHSTPPALRR